MPQFSSSGRCTSRTCSILALTQTDLGPRHSIHGRLSWCSAKRPEERNNGGSLEAHLTPDGQLWLHLEGSNGQCTEWSPTDIPTREGGWGRLSWAPLQLTIRGLQITCLCIQTEIGNHWYICTSTLGGSYNRPTYHARDGPQAIHCCHIWHQCVASVEDHWKFTWITQLRDWQWYL